MRTTRNAAVRRLVLTVLVALTIATSDASATPTPPYSKAEYWELADHIVPGLSPQWSQPRRSYMNGSRPSSVRVNSAMLVTHAIAALDGHRGTGRQDERARALADRLSATPVWLGARHLRRAGGRFSTCWGMSMERAQPQHPSLEPKVADALAWAWRARRVLALRAGVAARIRQRVGACANSAAWRGRTRVANQINWNAELYASAVTVGAGRHLLVRDYRRLLGRFATAIRRPAAGLRSPNLGRGYQFHYQPREPGTAAINLDSPEYANIVFHAVGHYERARRLGMRPLPGRSLRLMRAWSTRLLAGAWTHAGYLNWDTGKGLRRWHSAQYWAFAQQGLLALAGSPSFRSERVGRWAKALFDRGLELHRRLADAAGARVAPKRMFGVESRMESHDVFAARLLANIARAIGMGLGSRRSADPPPLYAHDPDTGRLAVTTPRYSTAIVPDGRGVLGYGGIEPARLFGPGQMVAGNLGGRLPGAFGVTVNGPGGRGLAVSQGGHGRLRVVASPHGDLTSARSYPARPYAGPFRRVVAHGIVRGGRVTVRSTHVFGPEAIDSSWRVTCRPSCAGHRVRVHFPSPGRRPVIDALLRSGSLARVSAAGPRVRHALTDIAAAALGDLAEGGYRLTALKAPRGARLRVVAVRREATNPHPGPSLVIETRPGARTASVEASARIRPAPRFSLVR